MPKHVAVEGYHNECLWNAFVGLCVSGKNMHGMNRSKFETCFIFTSACKNLWPYFVSACFSLMRNFGSQQDN